jgi:DNA-binding NarL/FixJ family response regulator
MDKKTTVLLADDHTLFRQGLRGLIEQEPDMEVVAEAESGAEAVQLAARHHPDVALLDISMPLLDGIEAGKRILVESPDTRVLLLSAYDSAEYVRRALQSGASGYLLKNVDMSMLAASLRLVAKGELVIDTVPTSRLLEMLVEREAPAPPVAEGLNPREMEVLRFIAKGKTNKEAAAELAISERTVQAHMLNVFRKLGVSSRTMAVLYALRRGWVALDDLP